MCGRVRLPTDYSEIKIRLRFDATEPAPNLTPSWNTPPTGDMLVATCTADGKRISEVMRWGLIPGTAAGTGANPVGRTGRYGSIQSI
jgi:putative SOS response-associated peptidase YedK